MIGTLAHALPSLFPLERFGQSRGISAPWLSPRLRQARSRLSASHVSPSPSPGPVGDAGVGAVVSPIRSRDPAGLKGGLWPTSALGSRPRLPPRSPPPLPLGLLLSFLVSCQRLCASATSSSGLLGSLQLRAMAAEMLREQAIKLSCTEAFQPQRQRVTRYVHVASSCAQVTMLFLGSRSQT